MNNIQGTQKVWITNSSRFTTRDIQKSIDDGEHDRAIQQLSFGNTDMSRHGWVEIGTAKIEVTFLPQDAVIEKLADGLLEQIKTVRAQAQSAVSVLEDKLNQLLALPAPDQGEAA